jgi:outer membrane protein assembly factor BamD
MLKHLLFCFSIFTLFSCNKEFNKLVKKGTTEQKYTAAVKYYKTGEYVKAATLFDEITPLLKGDSTAEIAQFYNAYCNYYQSNYQMSAYQFKNFYATYNNSPFAEESFYMYARSMYEDAPPHYLDQANTSTAIDALQTFINTFPDSKYEKQCSENLNELRYRQEKKAYEKAKQYFKTREPSFGGRPNYQATNVTIENFKKDFPDSKFNEELAYLQIVSMIELSDLSYYTKQKDRYNETLKHYEKFIDKFPNSKYLDESQKIYSRALKGLEAVAKLEKQIEEAKNKPQVN